MFSSLQYFADVIDGHHDGFLKGLRAVLTFKPYVRLSLCFLFLSLAIAVRIKFLYMYIFTHTNFALSHFSNRYTLIYKIRFCV
mgnify:CR=1 FL=1